MKKIVVLIVFTVFGFVSFGQNNNFRNNATDFNSIIPNPIIKHNLNTKSVSWKWDTIITYNELDTITLRFTQSFDVFGNILIRLIEYKQNKTWLIYQKETYTYDINGNVLTWFFEDFYLTSNPIQRKTFSYDNNNKLLSIIYEALKNNIWEIYSKNFFNYDNKNNLDTILTEHWENNTLSYYERETFLYNINNNLLLDLIEAKSSTGNIWNNYYRSSFTYDTCGNMLSKLYEKWEINDWIKTGTINNTYDSTGILFIRKIETWYHNYLSNYSIDTFTYDNFNNIIIDLREEFVNNSIIKSKYSFVYDSYGNSIAGKAEEIYNNNLYPKIDTYLWFNYIYTLFKNTIYPNIFLFHRYEASFKSFNLSINNNKNNSNKVSLYPNPTKETLNITNAEKGIIHIYNVLGEELMKTKCNEGNNTINVSSLEKGTYIFKMVSEKNVVTKKLVIN